MKLEFDWIPARSYKSGRSRSIRAIILHSTDGHEAGDIETLTKGRVSVHWYVTRAGNIYHFVADSDTAYHAGRVRLTSQHSNAATIGIEQEHIDGEQDWPDAQITAIGRLIHCLRARHGDIPAVSHAAVADPPGRKIDPKDYPWPKLTAAVKRAAAEGWTF